MSDQFREDLGSTGYAQFTENMTQMALDSFLAHEKLFSNFLGTQTSHCVLEDVEFGSGEAVSSVHDFEIKIIKRDAFEEVHLPQWTPQSSRVTSQPDAPDREIPVRRNVDYRVWD